MDASITRKQQLLNEHPLPRNNPSGLWCISCRRCGTAHCSDPVNCGGMIPLAEATEKVTAIRAKIEATL